MNFTDRVLDRKIPSDWRHVEKYPVRRGLLQSDTPLPPFERVLPLPRQYRVHYDQKKEGACAAFMASWKMSIYNRRKYAPIPLYRWAQDHDEFPETPPEGGTSLRAVYDGLRTLGHWRVYAEEIKPPSMADGIKENRWIQTVEQARQSIHDGDPIGLGCNWYDGFFKPSELPRADRSRNLGQKDYWLGRGQWGAIAGGHGISIVAVSDMREAFGLCNTWGTSWPFIVWLHYTHLERLMREDGEMGVVVRL